MSLKKLVAPAIVSMSLFAFAPTAQAANFGSGDFMFSWPTMPTTKQETKSKNPLQAIQPLKTLSFKKSSKRRPTSN